VNPKDIADLDQAMAMVTNMFVPHIASVFRAFCEEEGVTRPEALQLTIGYMLKPALPEGDKK